MRVKSTYLEKYQVKFGVHQGSELSPLLSKIVVDVTTVNARKGSE